MHPSRGVTVPWYNSPYESDSSFPKSVHQHLIDCPSPLWSDFGSISSPQTQASETPFGIVIYLPLITAAAKLIYISRREASPITVPTVIPVDREAAERMSLRWSGATQADLIELDSWCTWGKRVRPQSPATVPSTSTEVHSAGASTQPSSTPATTANSTQGQAAGSNNDLPWHTDSRRWDVDWWRMRMRGGSEWRQLDLDAVLYKTPRQRPAEKLGRLFDVSVLPGLWQGCMQVNEPLIFPIE